MTRECLTLRWADGIDYRSVDFDFSGKREIIRAQSPETGEWEEQWTGNTIYESAWQCYPTKKVRSLELTSSALESTPGRRKVVANVMDSFGNYTVTIVEVTV